VSLALVFQSQWSFPLPAITFPNVPTTTPVSADFSSDAPDAPLLLMNLYMFYAFYVWWFHFLQSGALYVFYAFYAWWFDFPQSGALAEGTSLPSSRKHDQA